MTSSAASSMNRRHFLRATAGLGVTAALADPLAALAATGGPRAAGIQLYTLQSELVHDLRGTFNALGKMGYQTVEVVGLLGHRPKDFRGALDSAGLAAPSMHIVSKEAQKWFVEMATGRVPVNDAWTRIDAAMDLANIESIMQEMFVESAIIGNRYLVMAAVDGTLFESQAGVEKVISAYSRAGDLCHQQGLQFAFHPHLAEFTQINGVSAVDRVLAKTDPRKVFIELDFFWAAMANADIPAFIRKHSGRFRLGHVKDLAKGIVVPAGGFKDLDEVKPAAYEDVGYGQLDYGHWLPLARAAGMREFFLERDISPDPLASAARSLPKFKALLSASS